MATPEQLIGQCWMFWDRLKHRGIHVSHRHQTLGATIVELLEREGYTIIDTKVLQALEQHERSNTNQDAIRTLQALVDHREDMIDELLGQLHELKAEKADD
jgi:hypothetical protein